MTFSDPINEEYKDSSLLFIKENIEDIMNRSRDNDFVDEQLKDISIRDIDNYITELTLNKSWDFNLPRIRSVVVRDFEKFSALCDYMQINKVSLPREGLQRVYFIESDDFASIFVPIELDKDTVNIFIEPLDCSPDIITEMYTSLDEKKILDSIDFINYNVVEK